MIERGLRQPQGTRHRIYHGSRALRVTYLPGQRQYVLIHWKVHPCLSIVLNKLVDLRAGQGLVVRGKDVLNILAL